MQGVSNPEAEVGALTCINDTPKGSTARSPRSPACYGGDILDCRTATGGRPLRHFSQAISLGRAATICFSSDISPSSSAYRASSAARDRSEIGGRRHATPNRTRPRRGRREDQGSRSYAPITLIRSSALDLQAFGSAVSPSLIQINDQFVLPVSADRPGPVDGFDQDEGASESDECAIAVRFCRSAWQFA